MGHLWLSHWRFDAVSATVQGLESLDHGLGGSQKFCGGAVGAKLSGARDCHLDDRRRDGREDRDEKSNQGVSLSSVADGDEVGEVGDELDERGGGGGDSHGEHIAVLDVADFVSHDGDHLVLGHVFDQALVEVNHGHLWAPAGGEGVGLGVGGDIEGRGWDTGFLAQALRGLVEPGELVRTEGLGSGEGEG